MNNQTKKKIIIDLVMTILFLLLMNTAWTGLVLHEWLGIVIVAVFAIHLAINRQWISSVTRAFLATNNWRLRGQYILNLLLTLAMGTTLVSGLLMSQYAVPFLASAGIEVWYILHAVSSWLTLGIIILHTAIHWRWIANIVRRLAGAAGPVPAQTGIPAGRWQPRQAAARLLIGLFALAAIYSLATNRTVEMLLPVSDAGKTTGSAGTTGSTTASGQESTQSAVLVEQDDENETTVILPTPAPTAEEPAVTLQEYLSKLFCNGCHKHCLLTNPRCVRGVQQAKTATEKYNADLEESGET